MSGLTEIRDDESDPHLELFLVFTEPVLLMLFLGSFATLIWGLVAVVWLLCTLTAVAALEGVTIRSIKRHERMIDVPFSGGGLQGSCLWHSLSETRPHRAGTMGGAQSL